MTEGAPLRKMLVGVDTSGDPAAGGAVNYAMRLGAQIVPLAEHIGRPFTLSFTGARSCTSCGQRVKKFYGQGLCYPCLRDAPEASECIVRPELCRAHLGEGRDPAWEVEHHHQEHDVYLSHTGGVKVGVTRGTQVPVRWIDQGAGIAMRIARTPYRQLGGAIEVDLKRFFGDRTNWRAMLQQAITDPSALLEAHAQAREGLVPELRAYLLEKPEPAFFTYPLPAPLPKVVSVSLEKLPEVTGTLLGVKGQYLVWADGRVLNVRNHSGFHVEIEPA
ncbi:MAG TPA: DUF2797 domain-containing protein [Flavobacteriales bacterium]|nr:DUF2797 domain-containing protein [Flavobacteriales bacterium]